MNIEQCKMARAMLGWSLDDLAEASGVGRRTIARFEAGNNVQAETVKTLRDAFEAKRVRFIDNGKMAGGIFRLRAG